MTVVKRIEKGTLQINPFSATTITADTITAIARPYILGSDNTKFEVKYGNVILDEHNIVTKFNNILNGECVLTDQELVGWGIDDSIVLTAIATKLNVSVVQILSGNTKNIF
jgi:hypothetical protein